MAAFWPASWWIVAEFSFESSLLAAGLVMAARTMSWQCMRRWSSLWLLLYVHRHL
jgi:hypothetical protein